MIPFKAPTDDILFSLHHVAGADRVADWDQETSEDIWGISPPLRKGSSHL